MMRSILCARRALVAAAALVCLAAASCTVETSNGPPPPPPPAPDGTVTFAWTINGTNDPNQCAQGGVATFHVTLQDSAGAPAGDYVQSCGAFATTVQLPPDRYTGQATLDDPGGAPRTTAINVVPFNVVAGTDLNVPLDFPASSFYAP